MSTGEKHRYDERPRERLIKQGEKQLSTAELLSILLRTGTQSESVEQLSERLLQTFYGLQGLAKAEVSELTQIEGIGPAKAAEIKAALELGRRRADR